MRTLEQLLCLWKCHEVWKSGTVDLCGELDLETGVSDSVCGTQLCHVPVCLCGSVEDQDNKSGGLWLAVRLVSVSGFLDLDHIHEISRTRS